MDPYESLEACLHTANEDGIPTLVGGDLNLRIGTLLPESSKDLLPGVSRISQDDTVSTRGRSYLRLCSDLSLVPLNGLCSIPSNHQACTYTKGDRQSVIDYVTASSHAIPFVQSLTVGPSPLTGSDHLPLLLVLDTPLPVEQTRSDATARSQEGPKVSRHLKFEELPEPISQRQQQHPSLRTIRRTNYPVGTAHRGRRWARKKGLKAQDELTEAALDCPPLFWRLLNKMNKHEIPPPPVQLEDLGGTFVGRMNPVDPVTHGFDPNLLEAHQWEAEDIPATTEPAPGFEAMNAPLTTRDVDKGKAYLKEHGANSTPGWDGTSQRMILAMDSEDLCDLGNECIQRRSFPSVFLLSLLVGIGKRSQDLRDPSNYRVVALESCLLKFFMLLIHLRFTEACEGAGLIPPTQNRF
jgi:hypothetical protein